jgi:hypothetical protein
MQLKEIEEIRHYLFEDGTEQIFFKVDFVDITHERHKIHHKQGWSWIYTNGLRVLNIKVKELTF